MPDLHSLHDEVRRVAEPPSYDVVLARARRRARRRIAAVAGSAAAVVVGVGAIASGVHTTDRAVPVRPAGPSPTLVDPRARAIVQDPTARTSVISVDPEGDLMTVYSIGRGSRARTAIAVRTRDGVTAIQLAGSGIDTAVPVPGGWLLGGRASTEVVDDDARGHDVDVSDTAVTPRAGDVPVFPDTGRPPKVYRPSDAEVHPLLVNPRIIDNPFAGHITPDGRFLVVGGDRQADDDTLVETFDGHRWVRTDADDGLRGSAQDLVGAGDHLVVLGTDTLRISDDGGRTWRTTAAPAGSYEEVTAAVTSSGTVLVAGAGAAGRVPPGGQLQPVRGVWVYFVASGEEVYGVTPHGLEISHDQGATWSPVTLPGR